MRSAVLVILCLVAGSWTSAPATTWRIELDGSGDFTDIQPAVEAAAPGDTIRLGPGRFQQFHPCVAPAWTEPTVVWVTKDDLVFLGSGPGVTIVGTPEFYGPGSTTPKTFCVIDGRRGVIRNLTMENVANGIYWYGGRVEITDCEFRSDNARCQAIGIWTEGSVVRNCTFDLAPNAMGVIVFGPGRDNLIEDCTFRGFASAILAGNGSTNTLVRRCDFQRPVVAFSGGFGGSGTMADCTVSQSIQCAVYVSTNFRATIERVIIDRGLYGIQVLNDGELHGTDIVIEGTTGEPLNLTACRPSSLNHSHVLPPPGVRAVIGYSMYLTAIHDLSGNWWGTTDLQAIYDMISDGNDDPTNLAFVRVSPIAGGEVPVESMSWGGLKATFR